MKSKKNIFNWILYDFANSLVSVVFFLYFAQWIVVDRGISDLSFNLTFTVSALLLLLTAPITGTLLDKSWRRITGLRITTILTAISYSICALMAVNTRNVGALIFFTLGLYFYLLSFTFYTPLIKDICNHGRRGIVSGLGIAANYLGQMTGLIIALPFASSKISLFQALPRAETLLPSVIAFFLLSLPMLLFFSEPKKKKVKINLISIFKETIKESKYLFATKGVLFFLLSYFLFNDAIMTSVNNFSIFLQQVWSVSDETKTYLLLAILLTSAVGGILSGLFADRFGHKKTLVGILLVWLVTFPFIGWINNWSFFVVGCIIMGLWFGASWTVSRSVMSYVAPKKKHNLAFAYFGLAERASSFVGPILWGAIATGLFSLGPLRYRISMSSLSFFILLGLLALTKVRSDKK